MCGTDVKCGYDHGANPVLSARGKKTSIMPLAPEQFLPAYLETINGEKLHGILNGRVCEYQDWSNPADRPLQDIDVTIFEGGRINVLRHGKVALSLPYKTRD